MYFAISDINLLEIVVLCKADMFFCGIQLSDWMCLNRRQYRRLRSEFLDEFWSNVFQHYVDWLNWPCEGTAYSGEF